MSYVPKYLSESSSIKHITADLQLEELATKQDLEGIRHADTSSFALKTNLSDLKTKVDKLDIPKLGTLTTDVADDNNETDNDNLETKVNNNDATTKTNINDLKTKVDNIDLTKYGLKSNYDTKNGNIQFKIPDVSGN